ncbi:3-dehydroquinate synthase [Evansella sp. AB-P1]|uniref:3-dehydroquinate synthase n=1 Tax=Evansella sp. AB-P1 TaxID=3037653 RepID=UPI00241EF085|nr:3-dehydroquinate synthase [Evansella sp. AB-P1]MDG5787595.1 3-dehydroquinate synthase [Evansella sp. AB-P1]
MTDSSLKIKASKHSYAVIVDPGSRKKAYQYIQENVKNKPTSYLIITDDKVASLFLDDVVKSFPVGTKVESVIVPHGEKAKSFNQFENVLTAALEYNLDRKSMIIALGGGVVGDLAGFVAATYMRGIPFVQMPTTLLAHDSSVGGKVGINHEIGKNLIGAFHPPSLVLYDPECLLTLPEHEWRSGFAEVIKHGFIADHLFLDWINDNITSFQDLDMNLLTEMLLRSIKIKADIVEQDEKEAGIRAYLNFGHTLGHAIEAELGYGEITHGEAVVIGMVFALALSEKKFNIKLPTEKYIIMLKRLGYNITIPNHVSNENLIRKMKMDKKSFNHSIHFVLLKEFGKPSLVEVSEKVLEQELIGEGK